MTRSWLSGLERLVAGDGPSLAGERVALFAGPGVAGDAVRGLRAVGAEVARVFVGEYGAAGEVAPEAGVADGELEQAPLRSLYGAGDAAYAAEAHRLQPRGEDLADVDRLVVDVQDIGARQFTPIWSAALSVATAIRQGLPVLLLDRPNPQGGRDEDVEGSAPRAGYLSMVGLETVATRHGMSAAELLLLYSTRRCGDRGRVQGLVSVVEVAGWSREPIALPTRLAIPCGDTNEGIPTFAGRSLRAGMADEAWVEEGWSRDPPRTWSAGLTRVAELVAARPVGANPWRVRPFQHDNRRPAIDLLTGGPEFRRVANADGAVALAEYLAREEEAAARFREQRRPFLRY